MGERYIRIVEVSGSNPLGSTYYKMQISNIKYQISKIQTKYQKLFPTFFKSFFLFLFFSFWILICHFDSCILIFGFSVYAQEIKEPNVAGQFYPQDKDVLTRQISGFLNNAPQETEGGIFCLIAPHAGYDYSGQTASFGYKLLENKPYQTVIIIGPSHYHSFRGASVYPAGKFRTPLGDVEVDSDFTRKIISAALNIAFIPEAFSKEHSVEVQLPFLQSVLKDFRIVPILLGDCSLDDLNHLASALTNAIGSRQDVLLIASTDLTHSYDYQETEITDKLTLSYLEKMQPELIYEKLKDGTISMCGGYPVVAAMLTAKKLNRNSLKLLHYTNSAEVTQRKTKGIWTVGYVSAIIYSETMLNREQKKRLLEIARKAIEEYLATGKRVDFKEGDPGLKSVSGAFVTLHKPPEGGKQGELRGCIGNITGQKPLFETIRDMAIESATADPRFTSVTKEELKEIEIEISVLSPLKKISSIDEFQLGVHGVLLRRGLNQGVFLPQVATETGWSKEEFLSYLCSHKAGISADAWKDPRTELYIFSALVFSENKL